MAVSSRNALFILCVFFTHLVLLYSAEEGRNRTNCPVPIFCNDIGNIYIPFKSNKDLPSKCGVYTVDCSNSSSPKIQLKERGYWYHLETITRSNSISIDDSSLQERINLLKRDNCNDEVFNELSLPSPSPIVNISTTNNLTLFRCNNNQPNKTLPNYFCRSSCFTYYTSDTLDRCSSIHIPIREGFHSNVPNVYNLSALTASYSLLVQVTEECNQCYGKHGECLDDNGEKCVIPPIPPTPPILARKGADHLLLKLGLGSGVAGLVVLALAIHCCSRRMLSSIFFWKKQNQSRQNLEAFLTNYGPLQVKRYSYLEVKKMTNSFKEKLGQGGYGGVYKGKLKDGSPVAVKILNRSKGNGEEFMNEVAAISRTSHVNIVSLLGFCFEYSKRALIYDFMPNGSLEKFIFYANNHPQKDPHLGWEALDRISLGIARGLEYLHRGCNTRILHFDIKPHNILLDENFSPKISDFGLAKICDRKESIVSMLGARGTAGYIAPEVFCRNFGGVSHKSDVYSFGMMLSEMVGGRRNINVEAENTSEIYFPHWIYKRLELDEELGLQSIMNDEDKIRARKMIIVSLWCIQTDPSHRPAIRQVIEMLEGSVDSLEMPPKPYLSSPPRVSPETADSSITLVSVQ